MSIVEFRNWQKCLNNATTAKKRTNSIINPLIFYEVQNILDQFFNTNQIIKYWKFKIKQKFQIYREKEKCYITFI